MRRQRRQAGVFLFAIILGGCAKLAHLEELLRLKAYSENKEEQGDFVTEQDKSFQRLWDRARHQGLDDLETREQVKSEFGPPVWKRPVREDGQVLDQWLYRYAVRYFDSPKIYVYFTPDGRLQRWVRVEPKPAGGASEVLQEKVEPGGSEDGPVAKEAEK